MLFACGAKVGKSARCHSFLHLFSLLMSSTAAALLSSRLSGLKVDLAEMKWVSYRYTTWQCTPAEREAVRQNLIHAIASNQTLMGDQAKYPYNGPDWCMYLPVPQHLRKFMDRWDIQAEQCLQNSDWAQDDTSASIASAATITSPQLDDEEEEADTINESILLQQMYDNLKAEREAAIIHYPAVRRKHA